MRNILQIVGGVAVAGAVAAGSTALTGTGLGVTGQAASPQVVGGQITQSVSGAVLSNIAYDFSDAPANTRVNKVTLTFSAATSEGRSVALAPSGAGFAGGADEFYCPDPVASNVTVCEAANSTGHVVGGYYGGLTSMQVTVS